MEKLEYLLAMRAWRIDNDLEEPWLFLLQRCQAYDLAVSPEGTWVCTETKQRMHKPHIASMLKKDYARLEHPVPKNVDRIIRHFLEGAARGAAAVVAEGNYNKNAREDVFAGYI